MHARGLGVNRGWCLWPWSVCASRPRVWVMPGRGPQRSSPWDCSVLLGQRCRTLGADAARWVRVLVPAPPTPGGDSMVPMLPPPPQSIAQCNLHNWPKPHGSPSPGRRSRSLGHSGKGEVDTRRWTRWPLWRLAPYPQPPPSPLTSDSLSPEQKPQQHNPAAHLTGEGALEAWQGVGGVSGSWGDQTDTQWWLSTPLFINSSKLPRAQTLPESTNF